MKLWNNNLRINKNTIFIKIIIQSVSILGKNSKSSHETDWFFCLSCTMMWHQTTLRYDSYNFNCIFTLLEILGLKGCRWISDYAMQFLHFLLEHSHLPNKLLLRARGNPAEQQGMWQKSLLEGRKSPESTHTGVQASTFHSHLQLWFQPNASMPEFYVPPSLKKVSQWPMRDTQQMQHNG